MRINKNIVIERPQNLPIVLDTFYHPSEEKLPLVLLCHGYKGFKDWGAWDLVAAAFADKGFFFVKFNFSHNGGTVAQPIDFPDLNAFGENNYSKELEDLNDVLDYCTKNFNDKANLSQIGLIGHSRGGGIATLFAAEDPRVTKLVSWAGVSDFGMRFPVGEEFEAWKRKNVFYVLNGRTRQDMPHYFQFWEDYAKNPERFNIQKACTRLQIPHLVAHGSSDTSVPFWEAEHLHKWSNDSELFVLEGADHVFGAKHPWYAAHLPLPLKQLTDKTIAFLQE